MTQYTTSNLQAGTLQAIAAAVKTLVNASAQTSGLRRAFVYDVVFGPSGVPNSTDCEIVYELVRQSTIGTGTNATPSPLDSADAAAATVSTVNCTVEPTTGVSLEAFALNQRNTQRWLARDEKSRLVIPATNLNGIGIRVKSSTYTGTAIAAFGFDE